MVHFYRSVVETWGESADEALVSELVSHSFAVISRSFTCSGLLQEARNAAELKEIEAKIADAKVICCCADFGSHVMLTCRRTSAMWKSGRVTSRKLTFWLELGTRYREGLLCQSGCLAAVVQK